MESVTIPDSVTSIGSSAFYNCSSLTNVTIGNSVISIGSDAFYGCDSLTSIVIPDSVTKIESYVFEDCSSLTSITIGNGVTEIGDYVFKNCRNLTNIYCKSTTPPTGGIIMFYGNASERTIYVPTASVDAYKSASYWSNYADSIVGYDFE